MKGSSTTSPLELAEQLKVDPVHHNMDIFEQEITKDVWRDKYRSGEEEHPINSFARVCRGVYKNDSKEHMEGALVAMDQGLWIPAGRIQAGAGTRKHVTLMNCFVNGKLDDSMEGISTGLKTNMMSLRMGGGIGTDFTPLRPKYAKLGRLGEGAYSSGPVSFMEIWDAAGKTIMSAGSRRGAMMGTLADHHPSLPEFLKAKTVPDVLTQFNVSILISDAFMDAVRHGEDWDLYFSVIPTNKDPIGEFVDDQGVTQFIYERWDARELWDLIVKTTYEYSEPGVIFIDRINDMNNLAYCEEIRCTNPCGEQPLPPHGCCLLGAINLARLVNNPFHAEKFSKVGAPRFDFEVLKAVVHIAVRFLDNVIDVTKYPLPEQKAEELAKRRIGLGISGLADAMAQLGLKYGSEDSVAFTRRVMRTIAIEAYTASALLAKERGPFPLYDVRAFANRPFVCKLPHEVRTLIAKHGIRNGVLLNIAPTGTTSLYYGDISSGIEPVFRHKGSRKVLQPDGSRKEYPTKNYGLRLFEEVQGLVPVLPEYMVSVNNLSVNDHVRIQAAAQEWIDASVSKTINCPENMTFEEFKEVYTLAYDLGCKGCTTYRPSPTRGSVLGDAVVHPAGEIKPGIPRRPVALAGCTYKIEWPTLPSALYLTVNRYKEGGGYPFEVFFNSRSSINAEWMTALSLMMSAIMRTTNDVEFIAEELQQVVSAHDSAWIEGTYYGSLVARIGKVLEDHFKDEGIIKPKGGEPVKWPKNIKWVEGTKPKLASENVSEEYTIQEAGPVTMVVVPTVPNPNWALCPSCNAPALIYQEGCAKCTQCDYSNCG